MITQKEVEAIVRRTVLQALGQRPVLNAEAVRESAVGGVVEVSAETLITPLARQIALERRIKLQTPSSAKTNAAIGADHAIAIGADHGGYELKEALKPTIEAAGYQIIDCGTHSKASVDYPDFAYAVARSVADGNARWGIVIDGAGIGSCMAANKVPGIRAAMCYDQATAANSREHNHANVLTLGAALIGLGRAKQIVKTWLATDFGPDRHARRVDIITQIERRYTRD